MPDLFSGIPLVPALVGLFAAAGHAFLEDVFRGASSAVENGRLSNKGLALKELLVQKFNLLRSSVIGTIIGIIPATGASAACFIAYSEAKRHSATPEAFAREPLRALPPRKAPTTPSRAGRSFP